MYHLNILTTMSNTPTNKRVKGSAIVSEEGDFIFTPYGTHSEEEKSMKIVAIEGEMTLWKTKNCYSMRLKIPFNRVPNLAKAAELMMRCFAHIKKDQLETAEAALNKKKTTSRKNKTPAHPVTDTAIS